MRLPALITKAINIMDERLFPRRQRTTEQGRRGTEDSQLRAMYERMQPSYDLYSTIQEIRRMDTQDGHVKQIHSRTAKALTKGGLILHNPTKNKRLERQWKQFRQSCQLNQRLKLISDARGLLVEGSLPLQWVLNNDHTRVMRCIRMPTETIRTLVGVDGQIEDPAQAYAQYNYIEGKDIAHFARWQLDVARLDPDNFDDMGAMGRPLLDATRQRWRQIMMMQDDSVLRRHLRSGQRTLHVLEGADDPTLTEYKKQVESEEAGSLANNYYTNKKGAIQAIEGDANLDQVADIAMLLDSWFAGTPMPKALLGYVDNLSRDVLMDMKAEYYDELDTLQDSLSGGYEHGFRLQLLIAGMNPDSMDWGIQYGERLTETPSQRTDRALKYTALGVSRHTTWRTAGLDPAAELQRLEEEQDEFNPYPADEDFDIPGVESSLEKSAARSKQRVTITEGNAGKNQSATDISNG